MTGPVHLGGVISRQISTQNSGLSQQTTAARTQHQADCELVRLLLEDKGKQQDPSAKAAFQEAISRLAASGLLAGSLEHLLPSSPVPSPSGLAALSAGFGLSERLQLGLGLVESGKTGWLEGVQLLRDAASQLASTAATWNFDLVVDILKATYTGLNWHRVVECLDNPEFTLPDQKALAVLVSSLKRAGVDPFPVEAVCARLWNNSTGQLSLLRWAVAAPPEVFTFEHASRKQMPLEGLHAGKSPVGTPNQAWLCLDLLETLSRLAEAGHHTTVRQILDQPLSHCPELLLLGIAAVRTEWGILQREICDALVVTYVASHPNSSIVLQRLWPLNREQVLRAMVALYEKDPANISRVLDVCQELKGLAIVLDNTPFPFCIELAALAARREYLNLEKWLQERIVAHQAAFMQATIKFLEAKLAEQHEQEAHQLVGQSGKINLSLECLAIFLRVLHAHAALLPPEVQQELVRLQQQSVQAHPQLILSEPTGIAQGPFAPDVETEANSYFQKIYRGQQSVDELIQLLKRFKQSPNSREQDVFNCMIHNLFDEYRFFHKYPERELHITALLFGSLIHHQLVSSVTLGMALRYVLEALRNNLRGSKMFGFAMEALLQFQADLRNWPQYCHQLAMIPHLREANPQIADQADAVLRDYAAAAAADGNAPSEPPAVVGDGAAAALPDASAQGPTTADQPIAAPQPAATSAVGAGCAAPAVNLSGQQVKAPGGQDVQMLPGAAGPAKPGTTAGVTAPAAAAASLGTTVTQPAQPPQAVPQLSPHTSLDSTPFPTTPRDAMPGVRMQSATSAASNTAAIDPNRAFQAINAETLEAAALDTDYPLPPQKVQDKVAFTINNLSTTNMDAKAKELSELLEEKHQLWFTNYLVVKRAAQEPNFHALYLALVQKLATKDVWTVLTATTFKYVKILLRSERIKTQSGERSLLKNLGSWLGKLTIAQNKPVRQRNLDLKGIIYEAYEHGKMIAVLPFVNKVLEPCKDSKVFRPPNPWLMGILSLVAEIYACDKLKLNLKFEIEMLFRGLNLQISDVKATDTLHAHKREMVGNADFAVDKAQAVMVPPLTPQPPAPPGRGAPSGEGPPFVQPAGVGTPGRPGPPAEADQRLSPDVAPGPGPVGLDQNLLANMHNAVQINPTLGLMAERLQLKRVVPAAVDRAIVEIITPVVERSVTISCMTTQELIVKDFVLEPDEARMRKAAHLMVSSLAGSLALVTCKEPLRVSLAAALRALLPATADANVLEQVVQVVTNDNLDLGCGIIEKAATDKAIREIDERLLAAYRGRQKAKASGQSFYDVARLSGRFPSSLPESLRPKAGHLNIQQQRVYDDFARIPRAPSAALAPTAGPPRPPGSDRPAGPASIGTMSFTSGDHAGMDEAAQAMAALAEKYNAWQLRLDALIANDPQAAFAEGTELAAVVTEVVDMAAGREEGALALARKIFARLFEGPAVRLHISSHMAALVLLKAKLLPRLPVELTTWFVTLTDERKFNCEIGEALLRGGLLHMPELDAYLAKVLSSGRSGAAMEVAVHLVRACVIMEPLATAAELFNTLEVLSKIAVRSAGGTALQQLVDQARRSPKVPARVLPPVPVVAAGEPAGLKEQVAALFDEWAHLAEEQPAEKVHAAYVGQLQQAGFLKGDELTDSFLRILTELAVAHCLSGETGVLATRPGLLYFVAIDAYVRLLSTLITAHGGGAALLAKALGIMAGVLQREAELKAGDFNSRPFYRICLGFISELAPSDPNDAPGFAMLSALAVTFAGLQPLRVPGFAFSWLELISHRNFMPKLLLAPNHSGWPHFQRLLVALLRFLEPYLRSAELNDAVRLLYKGALRVLLVLLHDFPEFLCEYHFQLCDVVPPSCIQMRNLILSAFPRNMRLPDPFTPNLKVDLLPEIAQTPRFLPEAAHLLPAAFKAEVDAYLATRQGPGLLAQLRGRLQLAPQEVVICGTRHNVPLLNALVFYVGIQAIQQLQTKPGSSPVMHSPPMDIFQRLATDLDTEGRYLFLNALANQLRYPNNHTHYFSCVLLYLFAEAQQEIIQEQITRVLLERLIVNRPHPWGLLITFIELIKNPRYNFWSYSFTHCAGEIERLFESVARSCMGPPRTEDDTAALQQEAVR
ncbi:hypothetical protein WJX72_007392 [[Myrmecia] bisecta]|uniref:CCR4-NOT transcription complex subunit 1 n=1 Tax=[Myrmecia] bisecta TaxID=41462 RepID=A0AAW1QRE5_9CHLO